EVSSSKHCARVRPVRLRSASRRAPYSGCRAAQEDMKGHFAITLFYRVATLRKRMRRLRHLVTHRFEHVAGRSIDLHALLRWRLLEEAAARGSGRSRHWLDKHPSRCNRALVVSRLGPAAAAPERAKRPER